MQQFAFLPEENKMPEVTTSLDPLRIRSWAIAAMLRGLVFATIAINAISAFAADLQTAEADYRAGKYAETETLAAAEVESGIWNERWPRLLIQTQLDQGKYAEALATYEAAIRRYPTSLTLRRLGIESLQMNDLAKRAAEEEERFFQILQSSPMRYASNENLIAAGRYFADQGEDARQILEMFYDRVSQSDPDFIEAYIATAELALQKGDFKVAAETITTAEKIDATDARTAYLLARSLEPSDSKAAMMAIERALKRNPNHIPSLLFLVEAALDRELYDAAESELQKVLTLNPLHHDAWSFRAVIAHLQGDPKKEKEYRQKALSTWKTNPRVDYLIGKKLSEKYRFAEGAEYQKNALKLDARHHAARFQLAQDLLRLGNDEAGWDLAHKVADEDPYNVVAHNLVTLHDHVKEFSVLKTDDIHVRMDAREALIYGEEVMELLSEAKQILCKKYDVHPNAPIVVEIFPEQSDFAIRTFGLPGGAGYLGVCFGRVITANSPASQGERPSNWKSVLWHEFCHVVTLEKTKNRMPRWLSEGISVYEERQRDRSWGERMTPRYREMILSDDLSPVSGLSAAFLNPPSPMHLQFAYYESSLVVEYLIEKHGIESLKEMLNSLSDGLSIEDAITKSIGSIEKLDADFAKHARQIANDFAPKADWSREELPERATSDQWGDWVEEHPTNAWGLTALAQSLVAKKNFADARTHLEKLDELDALTGERNGPLELLANVYAELDEPQLEEATHERIIAQSSDAIFSLDRLSEIALNNEQWENVVEYTKRALAIQPLLPWGHERLAEALIKLNKFDQAISPRTALLQFDPVDRAGAHYDLAFTLFESNEFDQAKRHCLIALEEAPRFRAAHRLLLQITERNP